MSAATKIPASVGLKGALDDADSTHGEEHAGKQFLCDCWRVKKEGRKEERKGKEKKRKQKESFLKKHRPSFCYLVKLTKQRALLMGLFPAADTPQNFVQTKQTSTQLWLER